MAPRDDRPEIQRADPLKPVAGATDNDTDNEVTQTFSSQPPSDVVPVSDSPTAQAPSLPSPAPQPPPQAAAGPQSLAPGDQIDDFEIVRVLGRGAFGTVYLARQLSLDRAVALKVATNQGSEGRTMARLEHQHIVQVFSETVDESSNTRLLCMQLVAGAPLDEVIRELKRRSGFTPSPSPSLADGGGEFRWQGSNVLSIVDRAADFPATLDPSALHDREALAEMDDIEATAWMGGRLAEALDFAHHQGVLHRDIKPANILVNQYGRPMLADFNIAQRGSGDEAEGQFGGTLGYMAPEHLDAFNPSVAVSADDVNEQSDIYSLGLVLHELLMGRPAFPPRKLEGTRMQKLNQLAEQRRETALPIPDGPPDSRKVLLQVISRSLDPEPAQRYQSGAEFADALDGCHRLRRAEIDLPTPGRLTRAALARPMLWLILFALLPHLAGSLVNVAYNNEQIIQQLREPQRELFTKLVLGYNVVIYPLALWLGWRILRPVWRCWRALAGSQRIDSHDVAAARRRALQLPVWAAGLAGLGWLPGGLLFPTLIDAWQGDVGWTVYAHFLVSFTLSGLIALAYSYCGVHYVVLRVLYPSMWLNPGGFEAQARQELRRVPLRQSLIPHLATSIPVLAVILIFSLRGANVGPAYEIMIVGLLVMGVLGTEVARGAIRRLSQTLVALTGTEG